MKKHLILSLLLGVAGSLVGGNVYAQEEQHRDDGRVNTFVIRNAHLTPEIAEKFNFIMPGDFSFTSKPDSYYSATVLPGTGALVATDKALIKALFPDANAFEVNGKKVTEEEFYSVPEQLLNAVKYEDGILKARVRENVKDENLYKDLAYKESDIWYYENAGTPMPAEVALNDPETYFLDPNTIVTLDYIITTPAMVQEKQADVKAYMLKMVGMNPQVYALTNARDLEYFGFDGEHQKAEVSAIGGPLTVENVAAYFKRPIEDLFLIKTDGKIVETYFKVKY